MDSPGTGELLTELFGTLRRSDQRHKAELYLRGLLESEGRKSIRNIAGPEGGAAAAQSLHHFICSSTWDWRPMRAGLARFLARERGRQAWVVRSLPIVKTGTRSVGVERQFVPDLGQSVNGQLAYGAWLADEGFSAPVHWRLHLPDGWLRDRERRIRAEIPEDAVGTAFRSTASWSTTSWSEASRSTEFRSEDAPHGTPDDSAVAVALEAAGTWGLPGRPVVLDTRVGDLDAVLRTFERERVPLLTRVDPGTRLFVDDPA
ncbi:transposase, partial [Streptomyces sp. UNOC14_S4]|uniref:IS701 family transposase n=1 Tax=Streptomyces sp. UNOC14_S4 TaxID=2872340 RepID=UPI001E5C2D1D